MAMQCTIPYDFAHTKSSYHVADWGKVTSVTDEHGDLGGRDVTLRVITIQGQRRSYRCPSDLGALGVVEAKPGDLLAVCAEDKVDTYQLAAGPIDQCRTVIPISQAPRSSELASLAPHHVDEMAIVVDAIAKGKSPKPRLDPSQRYLVWAAPIAQDGTLWRMDRYWLEVPSGIPGAELVAAKQRRWFVIAHPRFENDRFIVTAARVIDELFP